MRTQLHPLTPLLALCVLLSAAAVAATRAADKQLLPTDGRPIARIKESIICCPREEVHLDGWASIDVGGEVVEWLWDLNYDGRPDTTSTTGEMAIAAPSKSSSYSVVLRVRDNDGNISEADTATVHVMDVPPSVNMRADTTVKVGVRVAFRPEIRYVCAEPAHYEWDFDNDGTAEYRSRSNGNTSKVYYTPGRYQAKFRVIDTYGREGGVLTTVNVVGTHPAQGGTARAPREGDDETPDRM